MSAAPRILAAGLFGLLALPLAAKPSEARINADAATFHRFRLSVLAQGTEIGRHSTKEGAGVQFIGDECDWLARHTSPEFVYGMVRDLIHDDSRTEEPYMIAIMTLLRYPPDAARKVVRAIIADPEFAACGDVKCWLSDIDEAQKPENQPLFQHGTGR